MDKGRKKRKKKKRKKKEGGQTKGEREKSDRERERKGREKQKGRFSHHSDGRISMVREKKVDPCIASYARIPKSWSFVKLHEIRNFPTWIISSLKTI